MATRFYFEADTVAAVSPDFHVSWDETGEAVRRRLAHVKGSSAVAVGTRISGAEPGFLALDRQYVSDPLAAQEISGTAKCFLQAREEDAAQNVLYVYTYVCVVSNDGSTVRGDLLVFGASRGSNNELVAAPSAPRAVRVITAASALSSVNAQAGDRIVIEFGYQSDDAAWAAEANWGEDAADCPENETETTPAAGWIEFSGTITFQGTGSRLALLGVG